MMGRTGPRLVPFLYDGLIEKKYRNLIFVDCVRLIFSIVLPHKTKKLDREDEMLFKDWYAFSRNGKKYIFSSKHYTDAKQAMMASLRKSDYLEKVYVSDDKLTYRILSKAEVKEKKRLKKELQKLKKELLDTDSSGESGYGSGANSPQHDPAPLAFTPKIYEIPQPFHAVEANSLFAENDVLQNTGSGEFGGFPKVESMDTCISTENYLPFPDTSILFEPDIITNTQSFADRSADNFPPSHDLDLMECSAENLERTTSGFIEDPPAENGFDLLKLDSLSNEDIIKVLFKDLTTLNLNSPLVCEGNVDHALATQDLHAEPADLLTEELFKLLKDVPSSVSLPPSPSVEENFAEQISLTPDAGLPDNQVEVTGNIYFCKICIHLGKTSVLICEPQFETSSLETSDEFQIVFEESVLKEINGPRSIKEHKFINDHLMVILEPADE